MSILCNVNEDFTGFVAELNFCMQKIKQHRMSGYVFRDEMCGKLRRMILFLEHIITLI